MKRIFKSLLRRYRETFWSLEHQARKAGVNIGDNNFIASKFWSSEPYLITIGSNCQITGGGKDVYAWRWNSSKTPLSEF